MTDRTLQAPGDLDGLDFDARGLVPVVAQDVETGMVLMVAWANRTALERALETRLMHYWSRSRKTLWKKGETSGNVQHVVSLHADCDGDTVLARVSTAGPACHTGEATCFGALDGSAGAPGAGRDSDSAILDELWSVLDSRRRGRPEGSYTTRLLSDENLRHKKLGEETVELVSALVRGDDTVPEEAADLLYHVMVAVAGADREWDEVLEALRDRRR